MKLIEVARQQRDLLNEGIAYIAVWQEAQKNGKRSWFTEDIFPADTNKEEPIFDEEQKARLAEIAALDSNAVLLNGYYHAWIGSADEPLNAASIAKGIENHYLMHNALVSSYLADDTETDRSETETPAFEDLRLTESEELGLGCERRENYQGENGMSADDIPESITIEIPFTSCSDLTRAKENLVALLQSKATLIQAALGEDTYWYAPEEEYSPENPGGWYGPEPRDNTLPIEFTDSTVRFDWLRFGVDSDTVKAWSTFLAAAVKFSKTAKRVTAKDATVENEKFAFRTFMVKIGMNGIEDKWARKRLLQNLTGDSAFATPESKERWLAKHGKKTANKEETNNVE